MGRPTSFCGESSFCQASPIGNRVAFDCDQMYMDVLEELIVWANGRSFLHHYFSTQLLPVCSYPLALALFFNQIINLT